MHVRIDSCFVSAGRKPVLVPQCPGRYALICL